MLTLIRIIYEIDNPQTLSDLREACLLILHDEDDADAELILNVLDNRVWDVLTQHEQA